MMISVNVADKYAFEISEHIPNVRGRCVVRPKVTNELTPCAFTSIEQDVSPSWNLDES